MQRRTLFAVIAATLPLAGCGAVGLAQPRVYTSPEAPQYTMPKGQHFQGRGSKSLGTIVVRRSSVLQWASDGPIFQLWDSGRRIRVHTQEHAGELRLAPGRYRSVSVLAVGDWLVTISPG